MPKTSDNRKEYHYILKRMKNDNERLYYYRTDNDGLQRYYFKDNIIECLYTIAVRSCIENNLVVGVGKPDNAGNFEYYVLP